MFPFLKNIVAVNFDDDDDDVSTLERTDAAELKPYWLSNQTIPTKKYFLQTIKGGFMAEHWTDNWTVVQMAEWTTEICTSA